MGMVTIRAATIGDADELVRLWTAAGLTFRAGEVAGELASVLERDPGLVLVAEDERGLAGAVFGAYDGRRAWVNRLATREDLRGSGIARRLLDELECRLVEKSCRKVNLLIEPGNAGVVGFYERLGYYRDELIFMEKHLSAPASPMTRSPVRDVNRPSAPLAPICDGEPYVFVSVSAVPAGIEPVAAVEEPEGTTLILRKADAERHRLPYAFVAARITLGLQSALDAVGLTAAISAALAKHAISCNVVAGYHHDHLFVPYEQAAKAISILDTMRQ